eukprot:TRINITY_DN3091_c1_g1_i1.p9 TRINITY_DN3091_c1_g1~~TRINITY_DN3091_c1_g1_i1.p9  ORF type:complete len:184 (-),score=15.52 TRINITY_DN3091_c1_g1_i1:2738-3289(-)
MIESARITRGNIKDLSTIDPKKYDAIIMPGGFGVAKNLCDFAVKGPDCTVDPKVTKVVKEFHDLKKAIGMCCIAPVIAAKLFGTKMGGEGVSITLGKEGDSWPHAGAISNFSLLEYSLIEACESLGNKIQKLDVSEYCVDTKNRLYTTPWQISPNKPNQLYEGRRKAMRYLGRSRCDDRTDGQ